MSNLSSVYRMYLNNIILRNIKIFNNIKSPRFTSSNSDPPDYVDSKYKIFKDEDASIIFDVEEERRKRKKYEVHDCTEKFLVRGSSLEEEMERRTSHVLTVQEIVDIVKSNKAKDIFVIQVPPDMKYVQFMIIVSGLSRRHLNALAELIRKYFKHKISPTAAPHIEGLNSDWIALDLGNIAVHIMIESVRKLYDLESLWAIGRKYDVKFNAKEDDVVELLKKHSINLDGFQPA